MLEREIKRSKQKWAYHIRLRLRKDIHMTSNAKKGGQCDIRASGEVEVVTAHHPWASIAEVKCTPVDTNIAENLKGISNLSR